MPLNPLRSETIPCGNGRWVRISYPDTASRWGDIALDWWSERLPGLRHVAGCPTSAVSRGTIPEQEGEYYFKRFLPRGWKDRLRVLFGQSRAMLEWRGSCLAASHGILVPATLCIVEEYRRGLLVGSGVILKGVANAPNGRQAMFRNGGTVPLPDRGHRRLLLHALGREVGRWHRMGLCHGDMHLGNVLCLGDKETFRFFWIDHGNTRRDSTLRGRAKNLAEIGRHPGMDRVDRRRLWSAYCSDAGIPDRLQSRLLQQTVSRIAAKWREYGVADAERQALSAELQGCLITLFFLFVCGAAML